MLFIIIYNIAKCNNLYLLKFKLMDCIKQVNKV